MNIFYFLFLFISLNSFSNTIPQNYILNTAGEQIPINPSFFRVDNEEKCIFYKVINGAKEIKMNFEDFDYVMIRNSKFKSYKFKNSKERSAFFVLCESSTNSLIFKSITPEEVTELTFYEFHILDNDLNIIETHKFDNSKKPKSVSNRSDIFAKINYFFSSCSSFIKRLVAFDVNTAENFNLDIIGFFQSPIYVNCTS